MELHLIKIAKIMVPLQNLIWNRLNLKKVPLQMWWLYNLKRNRLERLVNRVKKTKVWKLISEMTHPTKLATFWTFKRIIRAVGVNQVKTTIRIGGLKSNQKRPNSRCQWSVLAKGAPLPLQSTNYIKFQQAWPKVSPKRKKGLYFEKCLKMTVSGKKEFHFSKKSQPRRFRINLQFRRTQKSRSKLVEWAERRKEIKSRRICT